MIDEPQCADDFGTKVKSITFVPCEPDKNDYTSPPCNPPLPKCHVMLWSPKRGKFRRVTAGDLKRMSKRILRRMKRDNGS